MTAHIKLDTLDRDTNADIIQGNAKVVGTENGWALPGCRIIRDEARARMYARRMAKMMDGMELPL